ncbi:TAP42-like protein [Terfezia boudieri ATCC MYA-4762]|uniref:TAP42-like protein n=1 Tax=Terfezia boudieri ATCC MYA-4762 TaxID=1051890 RepID=A0A3N4MNH8_9PEZI|nr:TAP42-like protein [Terfezia boudieri ATCC MYA-4762]
MDSSADTDQSLRVTFVKAEALRTSLEKTYDCNCEGYQTKLKDAIKAYEECKKLVADLSLFSPNEILEDISSPEIKYMLIDFYLGELMMKEQGLDRKSVLLRAQTAYKSFLRLVDSYDLLNKTDRDMFETLAQATTAAGLNHLPTDPGERRQAKIARFRQEKELKAKLQALATNPDLNVDEDVLRELYTTNIAYSAMQSLQALEGIILELDILKMAPPPTQEPSREQEVLDNRIRGVKADGYSDRLDNPNIFTNKSGAPLLSADGKPLRPFTIVSNREEIRKGVFRPGHNLPTMSIDEYLEEERRRGNIIEGGGEKSGLQPEPDEDNYEKADAETTKAREWDEFVENNPRGSGNTLNRG